MKKSLRAACASIGLTLTVGLAAAAVAPQSSMEELLEQNRPGPAHERLAALAGEWDVALVPAGSERPSRTGTARVSELLGGRFFDVTVTLGENTGRGEYRFTLGFDRRHDEYSLILLDDTGTYAVTARGPEDPENGGLIRMRGVDDDPHMQSLGFEKKYAFDLELADDAFAIKLHFVDTRTEAEPLYEQYSYAFTRR